MKHQKNYLSKRNLVVLAVFILALYVLVPQLDSFSESLHLLTHPDVPWVVLAIIYTLGTYFAGALTYKLISFKPLNYAKTLLVQFAAMFVNRLLPAGIGAIGANFVYLKNSKHSSVQAGAIVAVNNLLGAIGHNLLLLGVIVLGGYSTLDANRHFFRDHWLELVIAGTVIVVLVIVYGRRRLKHVLSQVKKQLFSYKSRPKRLVGGLLSSMLLTSFNILSLSSCAHALGVDLNLAQTMIVFSFAMIASTITPTPGGLGGFEAALVAGYVAYGVEADQALAVALLYRLIAYWLTMLLGGLAFLSVNRLGYLSTSARG